MSLLALTGSAAPAQQPPTFPSEVELVTVDAVVVDKEGHAVAGLTRDDFVVEEDGKPREIDSFEPFVQKAQDAVSVASGPVASNAAPPPTTGRAFGLILDDMSMENRDAVDTRRAVSTVLEKTLHDGDEVILSTTSGDAWWAARLPEGRADLLAIVARLRGRSHSASEALLPDWMSDYEAFAIANDRDPKILARVVERFMQALVCMGGLEAQTCPSIAQERAKLVDAARQGRTRSTLDGVRRGVQALATIRGRKAVILFSPGFLEDSAMSARDVEAISREANAAVYFIDVRGLFSVQDDASVQYATPATTTLARQVEETVLASAGAQTLAEETGGFSIRNTNGLETGAARIIDESRAYYLLGFHPVAGGKEGAWRKLRVRVTRPNLTVRARRGYTLRTALDQTRPGSNGDKKKAKPDPAAQALNAPESAPGIPLRAMTYVFEPRPKNMTHVVVAVEVDTDKITFQSKGQSRIAQLQVTVVAMNRDTGKGPWHDDSVTLEVKGSDPPGWRPFAREFELPAGVTQVRIVVRDAGSGLIGSVTQRFEVPAPGALRVSTPLVTERLAEPAEGETHSEPALAAHRIFAPEGKLYCRFEVLDAARPTDHRAPEVTAGVELRREGGEVVRRVEPVAVAADPNGRLVQTVVLSLDGLDEGPYDLVLDVRDQVGGGRLSRHEPLTLARTDASAATRVDTPRGPATVAHALRFAPNSPLALLFRYYQGERLPAITALRRWSEHDLQAQFDLVEALVLEAEECARCPNRLVDLVQRGRLPPAALEIPLEAVVRAAIMLHAEADRAERHSSEFVGRVEQVRACPGRFADWAGHYAVLLARAPATRDFARRFFIAMTLGSQWDACFDEAESWARRGLKQFPGDAELLLDLGSVVEERATLGASLAGEAAGAGGTAAVGAELKKARRDFAEAVSRDPGLVLANVRLGRVLWRLGQTALAKDALEQAVTRARDPRHAFLAYLFLGQIYEDEHRPEQAAADYRRALEIDPHSQSAAVALSHALLLEGDVEGSRRVLADGLASARRRRTQDAYSGYLAGNVVDREGLWDALLREALE